ncbi:hypothetical protein HHK36_017250 [Tetracentron sinense]|uniref:J domain-containing protein n=1 Tax=Tetracentron sinense TaxID=13715 RepID=A0A835DCF2_TETSI|nr:hypothetical protein HHK36_017250 [Tetracentron sinense]
MSPPLVDFRTPTTTQMQSNQSPLRNPNPKGQFHYHSFFDLSSFSTNNLSDKQQRSSPIDTETMNSSNFGDGVSASRDATEGSFDTSFASPFVLRPDLGKPSLASASGLSRPRLVKLRKHLVSQQGRSTPVSESRVNHGFNPFRPVSDSLDRVGDDSRMRELGDQWNSVNPFPLESAQQSWKLDGSNSSVLGDFKFGLSDNVGFVFGASRSGSPSNLNLGKSDSCESVGKSLPDEMGKLKIGSEMLFQNAKDAAFSLNASEKGTSNLGGKFDKGVFVFGSSSKKNSSFDGSTVSKLPDEMRKLNIEGSGNSDGVENTKGAHCSFNADNKNNFDFGTSDNVPSAFGGSTVSKLPDEMKKLNIEDSAKVGGDEKTKDANLNFNFNDKIPFVFGSSKTKKAADSLTGSKLPDEMKKLNIKDSGKVDDAEKSRDANISSSTNDKNTFVFGSSTNAADSFTGSSTTTLPDQKKNLNTEGSGNGDGVMKAKEANPKISDNNSFVFGTSNSTAGSFGGGTEKKLPDEMRKLNIGSRMGDSAGLADMDFSSSRIFTKEKQLGNLGDKIIHYPAVGNSIPTPFTFQAGQQGRSSDVGQVPPVQPNDDIKLNGAAAPSSLFSSTGLGFQPIGNAFEVPTMDRAEKKDGFSFTSTIDGLGTPHTDIRTPKQDASCSFRENLFAGLNQKLEFSSNRKTVKDPKLKKKRGKLRQPIPVPKWSGQDFASRESNSQDNPESPECYSPMDFSPYQETLAADQCSRETSMASDECFHLDNNCGTTNAHPEVSTNVTGEDFVAAPEHLDINEGDRTCRELNDEVSGYHFEKRVGAESPLEECFTGFETECLKSKTEQADISSDATVASAETNSGFYSNIDRQETDCRMKYCFASSSQGFGDTDFTFAASSSAQGHLSATKRHYRKKNRMKVGHDSYDSTPNAKVQFASSSLQFFPIASDSSPFGPGQGQKGDFSISQNQDENKSEACKEPEVKQESFSTADDATSAAQEACEKWRLSNYIYHVNIILSFVKLVDLIYIRGNQAYANGRLSTAEDYYTRGVNCVSPNETSISCLRALALCYSNRAATRMSIGRIREALVDCMKAAAIDPNFLKVQLRAANCHLALGEVEDALRYFKKCLQSGSGICLDRKIVIEASDGLQKAQKLAECMNRSAELLQQRTSNDADSALRIIVEALSISSYSDKLIEMKAEALIMLRRYEEMIQLCEQTLDSAENNFASISADGQLENVDSSECLKCSPVRLWRRLLIFKSYFYLGRLEEALDLLEKQEKTESMTEKYGSKTLESSIPLIDTVRELLRHKAAGNEAFQSGRHAEAVEHYTAALSCNVESRPFAAICFCNRAAAHQALGQITDAIADCSLAIALDGNYLKAISRRATLHEMIRDYGQAASDLQRLIALLEKKPEDKANQSGALGRSTCSVNDLRQARLRLSTMEEEAKKGIPLEMYLILGIEPSGTASDIKKAYRKAALRHHPDKAAHFLARSENGDDRLRKEIAEEVYKDADRLFKIIGEAYAVLSDPTKRSRYDLEEEIRNSQKQGNGSSTSRTSADDHSYPFERSGNRRQWRHVWKSNGNSYSRWSEASR